MNGKIDYRIIGKRLKDQRNALSLTQEEVARKANITPTYLSKIEGGKVTSTLETIAILADVLNLDLAYVISGCSRLEEYHIDSRLMEIQNMANEKQIEKILEIAKIIIKE